GFPAAASAAAHDAAVRSGLDASQARLIRLFGTAVYHLPAAGAVARVAVLAPGTVTRLATSIQVTRWLAQVGFPAVEPLPGAQLLAAYDHLAFALPAGLIHGDAWRGNLLRDGRRVVLADWDSVSTGPRETDLIPTLQAPRFGLPDHQRDEFIAAYGHDIRAWHGYPILREIRELSTLSAILRDGHANPAARHELAVRLRSIRAGDNQKW